MSRKRNHPLIQVLALSVALFVFVGVWITHEFPSLLHGPKTSYEILQALYQAPARAASFQLESSLRFLGQEGIELFIQSSDLPGDAEARLLMFVRGERFREVDVPFLFYLYELYGARADTALGGMDDLAYAEPAAKPAAERRRSGFSEVVRQSSLLRRYISQMLRLFDALFLQVKPGAMRSQLPVWDRYDPAAYQQIRRIVREIADDAFLKLDDALSQEKGNQYRAMLEDLLRDEKRLGGFVEFLTDLIRQESEGWLESYGARQHRRQTRRAWVEERIRLNRYGEIADYAHERAERRLAVHVVVDGLQGKLLEGLAQLSSGDRQSSGARYVAQLVRLHQTESMNPGRESKLPPPLGKDIVALAEQAPVWPYYLETFKKYVFSPNSSAVTVGVATVDTPSISIRNLPIVETGHRVAGPFGTGIPNFSYLDRRTSRGWYFWGSDVLYVNRIFANQEDQIPLGQRRPEGPGGRTLFERLWRYNTLSCMTTLDAGALEKIAAKVGVAIGEVQRNYMEKLLLVGLRRRANMEAELNKRRRWVWEHRHLSRSFLASLLWSPNDLATFHEYARFLAEHEDEGLPDYLLWYNPWPDHFAHSKGPYSDAIVGRQGEYDRFDFYLGKLVGIYESVKTADGQSRYMDRTLFGIVSDHGLIYTPRLVSTDQLLFQSMQAEGIRINYQKLTHDEGGLPAIRGRSEIQPIAPVDVVVGSTAGGSYVMDLFHRDALQRESGAVLGHPDYHELRVYPLQSGQTVDWIEQLKRRLKGTMDIALVREYGPQTGHLWPANVESVVRVISPDRGEARIYRIQQPRNGTADTRYRYEILGEQDPLNLVDSVREYLISAPGSSLAQAQQAIRKCIESRDGCEDQEWQELLSSTERPDVIYQFSHLYDTDRAGTINIFPARDVGMNSEVPGRHAGEMFEEKNGTQLYFGARLRPATKVTARNGSLPVTLFHWLAGEGEYRAQEGGPADQFGYPSLLDEPEFAAIQSGNR